MMRSMFDDVGDCGGDEDGGGGDNAFKGPWGPGH